MNFLFVLSFIFFSSSNAWAEYSINLKSPINLKVQISRFGEKQQAEKCKAIPSLPHKLESVAFYTDSKSSIIDPILYQQFLDLRKLTVDEEDYLSRQNTKYIQGTPVARTTIGQCLQNHLLQFAKNDVFTGSDDIRGGGAVRLMSVTPLLTYLILRDGGDLSSDADKEIRAWIMRLMDRLLWLENKFKYDNNIEDWTGAAVALGAIALNRHELLDHALAIAEKKARMVNSEGLLPLEMNRGRLAVEYSLSAAQALILIIAVAEVNGRDILSEPIGYGLVRMMRRLVISINDPNSFLSFTDSPEAIAQEHFDRQNMGWLEFYYRKSNDKDSLKSICHYKPLYSWRTGGDWFVLFGDPGQCSFDYQAQP